MNYKSMAFDSIKELVRFLNANEIPMNKIVKISSYPYSYTIWLEEQGK